MAEQVGLANHAKGSTVSCKLTKNSYSSSHDDTVKNTMASQQLDGAAVHQSKDGGDMHAAAPNVNELVVMAEVALVGKHIASVVDGKAMEMQDKNVVIIAGVDGHQVGVSVVVASKVGVDDDLIKFDGGKDDLLKLGNNDGKDDNQLGGIVILGILGDSGNGNGQIGDGNVLNGVLDIVVG